MLKGLTEVALADLETVLRHVHRGTLSCPLTARELATVGLVHVSECGDLLKGHDEKATRALLTAVIAERKRAQRP